MTFTEHRVADVVPIVAPLALPSAFIQPVNILSFATFLLSICLIGTAEDGGFDFAQPAFARTDDLHHEKFSVNYGTLFFMDWMHRMNVSSQFKKTENKLTTQNAELFHIIHILRELLARLR